MLPSGTRSTRSFTSSGHRKQMSYFPLHRLCPPLVSFRDSVPRAALPDCSPIAPRVTSKQILKQDASVNICCPCVPCRPRVVCEAIKDFMSEFSLACRALTVVSPSRLDIVAAAHRKRHHAILYLDDIKRLLHVHPMRYLAVLVKGERRRNAETKRIL